MNIEIEIYTSKEGHTEIQVQFENETVWLTQAQLVELYQTSKSNVSEHIKHIFKEGELTEKAVVRKFRTTANDGKKYNIAYYNLDMIISLGYRIKSSTATQFRQWATQRLKEHLIQGYTLNQKRLEEYSQNIKELENAVSLIKKVQKTKNLKTDETKGLLEIITKHTHSFITLNQFDSDTFSTKYLKNNFSY